MQKMILYGHYSYCPECHSVNSIEGYDIKNKPINYNLLVQSYGAQKIDTINKIQNRVLSYFECKKCRQKFGIFWNDDRFPLPMNDLIIKLFYDRFMEVYNKNII